MTGSADDNPVDDGLLAVRLVEVDGLVDDVVLRVVDVTVHPMPVEPLVEDGVASIHVNWHGKVDHDLGDIHELWLRELLLQVLLSTFPGLCEVDHVDCAVIRD